MTDLMTSATGIDDASADDDDDDDERVCLRK